MEQFSTVSLEIWTVHMISGYLILERRKFQFGANLYPFWGADPFWDIFFTQIFFLPKFYLFNFFLTQIFFFTQIFFGPNFFLFFHFSLSHFFFFFCKFFFNIISLVIQVNVSCMFDSDTKMILQHVLNYLKYRNSQVIQVKIQVILVHRW